MENRSKSEIEAPLLKQEACFPRDIGTNIPEDRLRLCLRITFGQGGNAAEYQERGWASPENGFTWSLGSSSSLVIPPFDANAEPSELKGEHVTLIIRGRPCPRPPFRRGFRYMTIKLDGDQLALEEVFGQSAFVVNLGLRKSAGSAMRLEAIYHDPVRLTDFGGDDDRSLAFAWQSLDVVSGPEHSCIGPSAFIPRDTASLRLHEWAVREMLPWIAKPVSRPELEAVSERLNAAEPWASIFRFCDGDVHLVAKPTTLSVDIVLTERAQQYLPFLKSVARRLPNGFTATICISTADFIEGSFDMPVFVFQKLPGEATVLVPDIEFVQRNFYEDDCYGDRRSYSEKTSTAVFAGATTGGEITVETAERLSLPRLRAASYFENNIRVDFRLPEIVQTTSDEAFAALKAKSFCARPRLTWEDQFRHRFIISMDGNGATCSRVVISLFSNSVLLKYYSPRLLYYFNGLTPWVHYMEASSDLGVDYILEMERENTTKYNAVALAGRTFALEHLTRKRVEEYMANILTLYAGAISN